MCDAVFLASEQPLTKLPWEEGSIFSVNEAPAEDYEVMSEWASFKFLYYVGGWMGCSCAFFWDDSPYLWEDEEDRRERAQDRASADRLLEYLKGEISQVGELYILVSYDGDEVVKPKRSLQILLKELDISMGLPFETGDIVHVKP